MEGAPEGAWACCFTATTGDGSGLSIADETHAARGGGCSGRAQQAKPLSCAAVTVLSNTLKKWSNIFFKVLCYLYGVLFWVSLTQPFSNARCWHSKTDARNALTAGGRVRQLDHEGNHHVVLFEGDPDDIIKCLSMSRIPGWRSRCSSRTTTCRSQRLSRGIH